MHAFAAYFVRSQQNTVKTDTKRISWLPRDNTKTPFGRFPDALGTLRASQDRSWDGSWATRTRHERGLERLQNGLERPQLPTIEFLFIFGSNWQLLGSLACCIRAFHRSFDRTFICSLDLSVTRSLRRMLIYVSYIHTTHLQLISFAINFISNSSGETTQTNKNLQTAEKSRG